jgi:7-alpha-hydroxysteroid dehydrogenase
MDMFRLDGKAAIVTGGSRGIGAASALALAECGADLVVSARDPDTLAGLVKRVEDETGRRAVAVPADLSDLGQLPALVDAAVSTYGRLDIVVNNVGGSMPRPFLDTSWRFFEEAFHWNVTTGFELTQLSVPHLLASGGGAVVNISSAVGHLTDRGFVAYSTAKAAVDQMTRLMAKDLSPRIRVNAVAPGSIDTEALATVLDDQMRQTMTSLTPLRRLGRVEDIAAAVVYLASDAGSFITGKVIEVDGGITHPNLPLGLADL